MKHIWYLLAALILSGAGILPSTQAREKDIPLSKVPKVVLEAAQKAVPGIKLTEAEIQKTDKGTVYEVEGMADGKKYEINIAEDGKVLSVKEDKDDADEKKDGTGDDDEDDD